MQFITTMKSKSKKGYEFELVTRCDTTMVGERESIVTTKCEELTKHYPKSHEGTNNYEYFIVSNSCFYPQGKTNSHQSDCLEDVQ